MGKLGPKCNKKANLSLNAFKLIRKYFNCKELLSLKTSNFFSVLLYNSEVWLSSYLKENVKHKIFLALKMCKHYQCNMTSFIDLHKNLGASYWVDDQ